MCSPTPLWIPCIIRIAHQTSRSSHTPLLASSFLHCKTLSSSPYTEMNPSFSLALETLHLFIYQLFMNIGSRSELQAGCRENSSFNQLLPFLPPVSSFLFCYTQQDPGTLPKHPYSTKPSLVLPGCPEPALSLPAAS